MLSGRNVTLRAPEAVEPRWNPGIGGGLFDLNFIAGLTPQFGTFACIRVGERRQCAIVETY